MTSCCLLSSWCVALLVRFVVVVVAYGGQHGTWCRSESGRRKDPVEIISLNFKNRMIIDSRTSGSWFARTTMQRTMGTMRCTMPPRPTASILIALPPCTHIFHRHLIPQCSGWLAAPESVTDHQVKTPTTQQQQQRGQEATKNGIVNEPIKPGSDLMDSYYTTIYIMYCIQPAPKASRLNVFVLHHRITLCCDICFTFRLDAGWDPRFCFWRQKTFLPFSIFSPSWSMINN